MTLSIVTHADENPCLTFK